MRKLFIDASAVCDGKIVIEGGDAYHIVRVLRKQAGDSLLVCSSDGIEYDTRIAQTGHSVILDILEQREAQGEAETELTLCQGVVKGEKNEWIIQKCVELGVCRIIPVMMKNCVVRIDEKDKEKKTQRWNKIAEEAAKQCGRGATVTVEKPVTLDEALAMTDGCARIVFSESEKQCSFRKTMETLRGERLAVFVGPEGGFDPSETEKLKRAEATCVTLGKRILRAETAAVAGCAAIMYENGELG